MAYSDPVPGSPVQYNVVCYSAWMHPGQRVNIFPHIAARYLCVCVYNYGWMPRLFGPKVLDCNFCLPVPLLVAIISARNDGTPCGDGEWDSAHSRLYVNINMKAYDLSRFALSLMHTYRIARGVGKLGHY